MNPKRWKAVWAIAIALAWVIGQLNGNDGEKGQ